MKVAVLGFGTVGVGVYEMLAAAKHLEQGSVLVRPGKKNAPFKVESIDDIINDDSIGAVAEVMGGTEPAYSYVSAALKAGKHVVSSNKALIAAHGIELASMAREHGVALLFSAACGGAVPFLHNISLAAQSDTLTSVGGILNGTTNFMLDKMQRFGCDYAQALAQAQSLGYAEADPTADVSGLDALRKIMLGCAAAFDALPTDGLDCEGIESLSVGDVEFFASRGLCCRLIASGARTESGVSAFVEPVLFDSSAPERSVLENFNMARYHGENCGDIVLMGQGAGRYPTASAVLRDLNAIVQGQREMFTERCTAVTADNGGVERSYYVRMPKKYAPLIPCTEKSEDGDIVRIISRPISVRDMHKIAAELRRYGNEVFFASIG